MVIHVDETRKRGVVRRLAGVRAQPQRHGHRIGATRHGRGHAVARQRSKRGAVNRGHDFRPPREAGRVKKKVGAGAGT